MMRRPLMPAAALVAAAAFAACSRTTAPAGTPQTPPAEGYVPHDERTVDRFTVQCSIQRQHSAVGTA